MYRRSLEMEENTTTTMSTNTQYNFVNRLFGLPVVRSVIDSATDTYGKTKEGNAFFKYTFGTAEQTVSLAMDYAMPVVGKFETQREIS